MNQPKLEKPCGFLCFGSAFERRVHVCLVMALVLRVFLFAQNAVLERWPTN